MRGEGDDAAPLGGAQQGQRGPHRTDSGHQTQGERGIPGLVVEGLERAVGGTDRVHERVQRTPPLADGGKPIGDGGGVGHVDGDADGVRGAQLEQTRDGGFDSLLATGHHRDPGALGGQQLGDTPTHSFAAAGDYRRRTLEAEVHVITSCSIYVTVRKGLVPDGTPCQVDTFSHRAPRRSWSTMIRGDGFGPLRCGTVAR